MNEYTRITDLIETGAPLRRVRDETLKAFLDGKLTAEQVRALNHILASR